MRGIRGGTIGEVHQWEIVTVDFPFFDSNRRKRRPALVISNDHFNRISKGVVVVQITSNLESGFSEYNIKITEKDVTLYGDSYLKPSIIKPYVIFTVDKSEIYWVIGRLSNEKIREVQEVLRAIYSL
ncbi:putative Endoribonuclease EndoA (plasmid) [Thermococcus nautili]|uniref:type II toxin-antitoxin system PemK/MazF family toxin n=1 Tax=Thermococcus nautili TaxID=195522 RepID=UPI0025557CDB|nr:type II toxin-antitoxin system PemK/MazF family toxin [Thermococcus nautili]CAI1494180.1 putative Endoribonuclease EndoA [Thermococcus nautili]